LRLFYALRSVDLANRFNARVVAIEKAPALDPRAAL
jgi:hypothetical protein